MKGRRVNEGLSNRDAPRFIGPGLQSSKEVRLLLQGLAAPDLIASLAGAFFWDWI
jgi:hypothetical protein